MKTINGQTIVLAIFGDPVEHSLSPVMHNAAFRELGWNCVYVPCRILAEDVTLAVKSIRALGYKGVNVTLPHKQAVVQELNDVFGDTRLSGSVNTIVNRDGKLLGTSTDGSGLVRSLHEDGNFDVTGKNVLIVGAGGSAVAIIFRLIAVGVKSITVINRDFTKVVNIQERVWFRTKFAINVYDMNRLETLDWNSFDLVINTTSVGLHDDATIIPKHLLSPHHFVYDLVYKLGDTTLINQANEVGCKTLSGLSLLLYQGVESFKIWFEVDPPIAVMREALEQVLHIN